MIDMDAVRRFRGGIVTLAVLLAAAIVLVVFKPSDDGGRGTGISRTSESSDTTSAPAPSTAPPATPISPPPTIKTEELKLVEQFARLYGSYPNPKGKAALLNQITPLVTPEMLKAIERQWAGPDVTTAAYTVTEVVVDSEPLIGSTDARMALRASVTQQATFTAAPAATFLPVYVVVIERRGADWHVADLQEEVS